MVGVQKGNVHDLRPKAGSESEKITINLGYVDLGHIDLLVRDGFYTNRTDFIRTAIRNQVERHAEATRQSVSRRSLHLGLRHVSREELRRRALLGSRSTSGCSDWSRSLWTLRQNLREQPSPPSPCSARCRPVRQ